MKLICSPQDKRLTDFLRLAGDRLIEIDYFRDTRTNRQNRYLHAIFTEFGNEFGYTADEAKQLLKEKFLTYEKEVRGKMYYFVKPTHELNTKEMTEFIEQIRRLSAEHGCYLPSPEEFYTTKK